MVVRIFCFIFIIQVVALLTQPCEEIFPNVLGNVYNTAQVSRLDDRTPAETQRDECSPFCICSCCSHPMATQTFSFAVTTQAKQKPEPTPLAEYTNPYSANHSESIWQPPKA